MLSSSFDLELLGSNETICGIDEVGRGSWAGPLLFVGVVLNKSSYQEFPAVADSKTVKPLLREKLSGEVLSKALGVGFGWVSSKECDTLGMSKCLRLATSRVFTSLSFFPDVVIIDGPTDFSAEVSLPETTEVHTVVKGDSKSVVVAAASIVAKVARDAKMVSLASKYPHYGFDRNKGYSSKEHQQALKSNGLTDIHRSSWKYVERLGLKMLG